MSTEFGSPSFASLTGQPLPASPSTAATLPRLSGGPAAAGGPAGDGARPALPPAGARTFASMVDAARGRLEPRSQAPVSHRVAAGDTLSHLVRDHMDRLGRPVSGGTQLSALVRQVADANGIADPDRIQVGMRLDLGVLGQPARALAYATGGAAVVAAAVAAPAGASAVASVTTPGARVAASAHPVLDQTLQRAVDKGFLPEAERLRARERVLQMARTFGFEPDDFARVALMESDGFNPKATNGRCHGIIQFCEGPARGAASVGLEGRAAAILDRGVLEQLELVDQYFRDVGLQRLGPRVSLADLYLTVLTPAARSVRGAAEPLGIPGVQARALHEGGDRSRPITRSSLTDGLLQHASLRLAEPPAGKAAIPQRQVLAAGAAYRHVAMLQAPVPRPDREGR
jgi:hypothetical protein